MSAQAVPGYERYKTPVNNKEHYLSIRGLSSHPALSSYMGKGIEIVLVPQANGREASEGFENNPD